MRTLQQALDNAERCRRELPDLMQPENSCYDMILLADEVYRLRRIEARRAVDRFFGEQGSVVFGL